MQRDNRMTGANSSCLFAVVHGIISSTNLNLANRCYLRFFTVILISCHCKYEFYGTQYKFLFVYKAPVNISCGLLTGAFKLNYYNYLILSRLILYIADGLPRLLKSTESICSAAPLSTSFFSMRVALRGVISR